MTTNHSENGTPRTLNEIHMTQGGTHITNFSESERAHYVESVRRFNDERLVVSVQPTSHMGHELGGALHWVGEELPKDLSPFWRLFETVRELSAARSALAEKERELERVTALHKGLMAEADKRLNDAEARAGEAEKDARRYRYLRDVRDDMLWCSEETQDDPSAFDAAIDAALAAPPAGEGGEK